MNIQPRILFLCALLFMALVPTSRAQDEGMFGLSQADFVLLAEANTATAAVSSLQFEFEADLALSGVPDASGTLNLDGSGALLTGANPSLDLTVSGETTLGGSAMPLSGEFRVVDGVFYFNLTDPTTGQASGWTGQPLDDIANGLANFTGAPVDPASLAAFDPAQIGAFINQVQPQQFIAMRRDDDDQNAAHFLIDLDFDALFTSPFIESALARSAALDPNALTARQYAAMLEDSTFRVEQWIELADKWVNRTRLDLVLHVSPTATGAQNREATAAFTFDISLSQFNETVSIAAPENALLLTATVPTTPEVNTVASAQSITANTPMAVQLTGQGAVDFTYTATGAETINVTARSVVANTVDTTVEVLDSSGVRLAYNDDRSPAINDSSLGAFDSAIQDLALPGAGTYTIRVGSFNNTGFGEVELLVQSSAAEATSSDTPPAGTTSEVIPGAITPGGVFAYSFAASEGETITIAVLDASGTLDPRLLLMDSGFDGLTENDDHASDDPALDSLDAKIEDFVVPASGAYNLLVSDFDNAGGAFELLIIRGGGRVSDFPGYEPLVEPPPDDPNAIALGDEITLNLDGATPGTRTFYGSAGQQITITARAVNPTSPDIDVHLTVFDANGRQIAFNDDHGTTDSALGQRDARIRTLMLPASGAYRIEVDTWFDLSGEATVQVEEG